MIRLNFKFRMIHSNLTTLSCQLDRISIAFFKPLEVLNCFYFTLISLIMVIMQMDELQGHRQTPDFHFLLIHAIFIVHDVSVRFNFEAIIFIY